MNFEPDTKLPCSVVPAVNFNERVGVSGPDILLIHYTGMESGKAALDWLVCEVSQVSCHYLVEEDGTIVQMVPEKLRAWHAGKSSWMGATDINSRSIGIEIVNPGHEFGYRAFPGVQIEAVIRLGLDICGRRKISSSRVLGHSDVAPGRKTDPGELFPWDKLAERGLGHSVMPAPIRLDEKGLQVGNVGEAVRSYQEMLINYGYGLEASGTFCEKTRQVTEAFQQHFRPRLVNGVADRSTIETVSRLLNSLKKLNSAAV